MYSAVHHEGRRLYELAREGVEVVRQAREVVVHAIAVEAQTAETATLRIVCGKGMYVRVLAADLGARLGCGAAVERLVRRQAGPFDLAAAVPWVEVTPGNRDALMARLLPPDAALAGWPALCLDEPGTAAFVHGQTVAAPSSPPDADARFLRVYDAQQVFLGVGERQAGRVKPARILHADRPGTRQLPA
jgi:tRNA pseudouridine55 synthase